jgi:hypothetical protein
MVLFGDGQKASAEYFRTLLMVDTQRIFAYDLYGGVTVRDYGGTGRKTQPRPGCLSESNGAILTSQIADTS